MMSRNKIKQCRVNEVFLIGTPIDQLNQSILPTNHDVLSRLFYYNQVSKITIKESCSKTSEEVLEIWKKASVPTILTSSIMKRILSLHKKWNLLHKNFKRKTTMQKNKENIFSSDLKKLFDVSNKEIILDPFTEKFLIDQRYERMLRIKSYPTPRKSKVSIENPKERGMFVVFLSPTFLYKKLFIC